MNQECNCALCVHFATVLPPGTSFGTLSPEERMVVLERLDLMDQRLKLILDAFDALGDPIKRAQMSQAELAQAQAAVDWNHQESGKHIAHARRA